MKNSKRIHKVVIKRMMDDDPDTSWLGEYSNRATSEFSIDRASDEFQGIIDLGTETLQHATDYLEDQDSEQDGQLGHEKGCSHRFSDNAECVCIVSAIQQGNSDARDILSDCSDEITDVEWSSREFRYFNPSFNYVDKHGKALPENTPDDVRKYVRQDYERMESLNNGSWCFVGIRAECEYSVTGDPKTGCLIQELTSGGLWGIESDSGSDYFKEIEQEELSQLKEQLSAIGFSKRAISAAFKTIETEEN